LKYKKMKVTRKIRRVFSPLNVTASYNVTGSALSQVYNSTLEEYEPNRVITPTIITPEIMINDIDGVFGDGNANRKLSNIKWYVDGVDLTTLADFTNGLYLIDTSDTITRGALKIFKNVNGSLPKNLSFRAMLPDSRRSVNITIAIDNILLSTQNVSPDKYTLEIDQPVEKIINPISLNNYTINSIVYRGGDKLIDKSDLDFELYYISGGNTIKADINNSPEIIVNDKGIFTFDLRMIQKRDYEIKLLKNTEELASVQFSILRKYSTYTADIRTFGDLRSSQSTIRATALINYEKTILENPGLYFYITWFTYSNTEGTLTHNMGEQAEIVAQNTGIDSGNVDLYFDIQEKPAMEVATESNDEIYTDNLNEPYIFN